jgi:hypothetical protein
LPPLCGPGAIPVRRIFDRRNNPAVCQNVRTGPWNKSGISEFQRLITTNIVSMIKPTPRIPKPTYFKIFNAFILIIF